MRKSVLALALVALLPGCSDEEANPASGTTPKPAPTPEPTVAFITVTVNPVFPPAIAVGPSTWAVTWQTTVQERVGIAGTVTAIDVHFVDAVVTYIGPDLNTASTNGSVALAARGSLTFNQGLVYATLDGNVAVVSTVVWVRDSRGNLISQVAQLRITS